MSLDYLALFVSDVGRSLAFYRDILGFDFDQHPKNEGVEGRSGSIKIGIYSRGWLPKLFPQLSALPPLGNPFLLSMTVGDLDVVFNSIQAHTSTYYFTILQPPTIMPWKQRVAFLLDPDGNLVELVSGDHST
ncbi:MAG: bleomycin resistance protein [Oscillatoriales cyanobacterium SM2_2_1]|nr:bleomycin resistance protein [Oscillatoriales cyanobacterium SM2_2_1]